MSKWRFEHDKNAYFTLMKSDEVMAVIEKAAGRVCDAANSMGNAGDAYEMHTGLGSTRAHANVSPANIHAVRSNAKHNTLLKALRGTKM